MGGGPPPKCAMNKVELTSISEQVKGGIKVADVAYESPLTSFSGRAFPDAFRTLPSVRTGLSAAKRRCRPATPIGREEPFVRPPPARMLSYEMEGNRA